MSEEQTFEEYLKQSLRRGLDKMFLEEVTGPTIYGAGNFEVYLGDDEEWDIRPVKGWKPAEPLGIVTDYPAISMNHIRDYLKENDPDILKAIDDRSYITFARDNEQSFTWAESIEEWKDSWIKANPTYLDRMKNKSAYVLFPSTKDEVIITAIDDVPMCPDCVQGKHGNCTGTSWNNTKDEETSCPCALKNHPETWIEDEVHTVFHDDTPYSIYGSGQGPKSNDSKPTASEALYAEAKWLRNAHANSVDKYSITYRDGFAAAIGWVEFHAKQAKEKEM